QFEPSSQDEDLVNIANELEDEPRYHLRKRLRSEERVEANFEESEAESELVNFEDTEFIDPEDLQGASLDDAIDVVDGKPTPERVVKWPNDAYRDFLELIVEGNISNKIGDKIIKFFNKHSNLDKSPLPSSTKNGKDYLNQINSPLIDFKEKVVATYNEINFTLYYRPLFRAIQALLQRPEVANNFVHKGIQNKMKDDRGETRIFGEPFEDTGIKTTESFRSLQRDVYHKCFKIMLQPLLEKSEALYFGINGQVITFAARISFFLADMLEADDITATYKGARCKMPCHTCMVLQSDLNNMSLKLENVPHRTHENMKQVINDGQGKEYSVHSVENSFWKFPNLNIYEACVPDRMHHIDLGLFKYQLEFTQDILKAVGGTELQKKFDDQLRQISRFLGLKLLHKLGHLNVLTASDYRNIMKIALFALDEIFEGNEITCKELCELYAKFSKMYIMSRKEMYTEEDLKIFE
ncbi:13478_t:CDS:2, partial [Rhizophagus irregularis]